METARERGWKYCTLCERPKPLSEFHKNARGNPQGRCRRCHRFIARRSYQKAMRHGSRRRMARRARERYARLKRAAEAA